MAPVLDPTWQSPYTPSTSERHANQRIVRTVGLRKMRPRIIVVAIVVVALFAGAVAVPWLALVGLVVGAAYAWESRRSLARFERRGLSLANTLIDQFKTGGSGEDRLRLVTVIDRLSATFGVDAVSAFIVDDPCCNAALVPNGDNLSLFVTSSMMSDFELIEIEGVVAHCLARQRLGLLNRQSVAATASLNPEARRLLAGSGTAYRADEVAAAAIRYPLGLASALHKCARQVLSEPSFFTGAMYADGRWVWFNMWSDRGERDLSDLDDVELRALALEEW